jgi:c-di-AMP phosphodiesterase-like protein
MKAERDETIAKAMNLINETENIYLFGYRSKVTDAIGAAFGIDFSKKRLKLSEIKKMLGNVKK